jgi:hypothetical protein
MRIKAPLELSAGVGQNVDHAHDEVGETVASILTPMDCVSFTSPVRRIVKFETNLPSVTGPIPARIMPLSAWNKLPPDIQKIFDANKEWWSLEAAKEVEKVDAEGLELAKKVGIQFIQLPQAEVQKFNDLYEDELVKAAKGLDAKGPDKVLRMFAGLLSVRQQEVAVPNDASIEECLPNSTLGFSHTCLDSILFNCQALSSR